jgi:hypothetical protein
LAGGATGERQQHDSARIGAADNKMRDAVGEGVGFTRSSAHNDQQWWRTGRVVAAIFDRTTLLWVQIC